MKDIDLIGYLCVALVIILFPIWYPIELIKERLKKEEDKNYDKSSSYIVISPNYFPVNVPLDNSINSGYIANNDWRKKQQKEEDTSVWEYMLANDTGSDTNTDED